jgi:hypothetical protein
MHPRFLLFYIAVFLFSCAKQGVPTGGPKDTIAPRPDSLRSTPNYSTRFNQKQIELVFNEWVVLSDVPGQVVISPPLTTKKVPDIQLKGKKVVINLPENETLRPNTTYTINFGTAIKDYHENNPAKDLRFVFSTGDLIDSLSVQGTVRDAVSGDPVENISILLYDILNDSVILKEKPYYFSKTDKAGQFRILNVRSGVFKCVAIDDADQNLKWSGESERIAFPDSLFKITDTTQPIINLRLFKEVTRLRTLEKNADRYGLVKLVYNLRPDSIQPYTDNSDIRLLTERTQDTLLVWYDRASDGAWDLIVGKDTIAVKEKTRADFIKNHRPGFPGAAAPTPSPAKGNKNQPPPPVEPITTPASGRGPRGPQISTITQNPAKPGRMVLNYPIASVDTSKWLIFLDSVPYNSFKVQPDSLKPRELILDVKWVPGKNYRLTLLPGAITDFYGIPNQDTLERAYNVLTDKLLGSLNLSVQNLTPGRRYVLQLQNSNTVIEEERFFEATTISQKFVFAQLLPTQYTARLIEDRNGNRRLDSGSYLEHRQPEAITVKKLDNLRPNWELEATIEAGNNEKSKKG